MITTLLPIAYSLAAILCDNPSRVNVSVVCYVSSPVKSVTYQIFGLPLYGQTLYYASLPPLSIPHILWNVHLLKIFFSFSIGVDLLFHRRATSIESNCFIWSLNVIFIACIAIHFLRLKVFSHVSGQHLHNYYLVSIHPKTQPYGHRKVAVLCVETAKGLNWVFGTWHDNCT